MILIALLIPIATAVLCYALRPRLSAYASLLGSIALVAASAPIISGALTGVQKLTMFGGALCMDALSGYMMGLVVLLGLASAAYSISYLEHELSAGLTDAIGVRRYYALFHLFIFTMLLVTVSNNLALMWIAVEATTAISALLIGLGFYKRPLAVEAAWKYLILCTVGITFALLGTFITYYASASVIGPVSGGPATGTIGSLNWTELREVAGRLNPATMRLAFIFVLIGYGTKAGLAPVHNWLPDAHSQAPSPISALLSGILLNTAFYGVLRFVSIVSPSTGSGFTGGLLIIFGLVSIGISAAFILVQDNYKRLLAYSSIEHMGIVSLGAGIGGPAGLYGALLHVLNHALSKPLMFFASGKIQAGYGSTRIEGVSGVLTSMPLLGALTFIGALSLAGTPPFNIFISEFTVLMAGVQKGMWVPVGLFLFFVVIVFYGMLSGFGKMLFNSASGEPSSALKPHKAGFSEFLSSGTMVLMAALIIALGLRVPAFIDSAIKACVASLGVM